MSRRLTEHRFGCRIECCFGRYFDRLSECWPDCLFGQLFDWLIVRNFEHFLGPQIADSSFQKIGWTANSKNLMNPLICWTSPTICQTSLTIFRMNLMTFQTNFFLFRSNHSFSASAVSNLCHQPTNDLAHLPSPLFSLQSRLPFHFCQFENGSQKTAAADRNSAGSQSGLQGRSVAQVTVDSVLHKVPLKDLPLVRSAVRKAFVPSLISSKFSC